MEQSAGPISLEGRDAQPEPASAPDPQASVPDIRLAGLTKRYGDVVAVGGIDLEIAHGEFFTMLGPSGSGKTTTLRMIAGFESPTPARVELAGRDVSRCRRTTARSTPSSRTTPCSRT